MLSVIFCQLQTTVSIGSRVSVFSDILYSTYYFFSPYFFYKEACIMARRWYHLITNGHLNTFHFYFKA